MATGIKDSDLPAIASAALTPSHNIMVFTPTSTEQVPLDEAVAQANALNDCECMKSFKVTLTSAQIQALGSTPIDVTPAPDAGYCIDPISVAGRLNHNGIDYVGGGNLIFDITGTAPVATITDLVQGSSTVISKGTTIDGSDLGNLGDGQPMKVLMLVNPTTGNSTITLYGLYRLMKL